MKENRVHFSTRTIGVALVGATLGLAACEQVEVVRDAWRGETPHEQYLAGLHAAGLAGTGLSQAWLSEAAEAIRDPVEVELPILDEGWFAAEEPRAIGYRFSAPRGRLITVALEANAEAGGRVFIDFMRLPDDPSDPPRPVEADTLPDGSLQYEPRRDGDFVVRVQPELLYNGSYRLTLGEDPALAFPVAGHGMRSIQSVFGVARDGGRRRHHGVDIFARRGTPVVASVAGEVNRVEVTNLGGKVVWVRDTKLRRNLYYAHLDSQTVSDGDRVEVGDTVGFVGNTGNARTTPPHLHFGIYSRGPTDPDPYLRPSRRQIAELDVDPSAYGAWMRTENEGIRLRSGPSRRSETLAELPEGSPLRVVGGSGDWYRVEGPDGAVGYIAARLVEAADAPLGRAVLASDTEVRSRPAPEAPPIDRADATTEIEVLARTRDFSLVRAPSGRLGWVASPALSFDD